MITMLIVLMQYHSLGICMTRTFYHVNGVNAISYTHYTHHILMHKAIEAINLRLPTFTVLMLLMQYHTHVVYVICLYVKLWGLVYAYSLTVYIPPVFTLLIVLMPYHTHIPYTHYLLMREASRVLGQVRAFIHHCLFLYTPHVLMHKTIDRVNAVNAISYTPYAYHILIRNTGVGVFIHHRLSPYTYTPQSCQPHCVNVCH